MPGSQVSRATPQRGENQLEARRQRDLKEYTEAVNKGYRNRYITERMKK